MKYFTGVILVVVIGVIGYFAFTPKITAPTVSPIVTQTVQPSTTTSIIILPNPTPTKTPAPSRTPVVGKSGIVGTITSGPTCPVQHDPPDPKCADKPYVGTVKAYRSDTKALVKAFTTTSNGTYLVALPPGVYYLTTNIGLPGTRSRDIEVKADTFTQADIVFDTGIR